MIDLLCAHGADPTVLNSAEQTALHVACAANRPEIVQALHNLTQASLLEVKDHRGQTALSVTTHPAVIDQLIAFGADIASLDRNHMNAIMIATATGQLAAVRRFLAAIEDDELGVLEQIENRNDYSLFLIAVRTGSVEMCSLLLTHAHVRWDTVDRERRNALHLAARNNYDDLIEFLCNYIRKSDRFLSLRSRSYSVATTATDSETINLSDISPMLRPYIDAQNEDGKTPLHLAAEQGHEAAIQSLLRHGADPLLGNHLGQLPLHAAVQSGHTECVELLIKTSLPYMNEFRSALSRRQSPLIPACEKGYVDIVRLLISENIGLDFDPEREETPLEIAIKHRQTEVIHVLLEHPHTAQWLMSTRHSRDRKRHTPLRDMIRYMPECAEHVFDKLVLRTSEIDYFGAEFERTTFQYRHIDDYFKYVDELRVHDRRFPSGLFLEITASCTRPAAVSCIAITR